MKLDVLIPVGEKGGVENVINMTVPFLMEQGMDVRVVQMIWEGVEWVFEGIPFHALMKGLQGHTLLEMIETYVRFLEENGMPDVILATTWPSMCDVAKRTADLFPAADIKVISWLHAPVKRYIDAGYGGYDYLGMADAHLAISKEIYDDLTTHFPDRLVKKVYNPVDFAKCLSGRKTDTKDAGEVLTDKTYHLFYVGRVSEEKRIDVILQGLSAAGDNWELTIVGDDDTKYGKRMKEFARTLKVWQRVHFVGWQEEPWRLAENADAVVLASEYEGFPLTAIEAQAGGLPVISTPVSGITELIEPGVNGYLFPFGDWKTLGEILCKLAQDEGGAILPDCCRNKVLCYEKSHAVTDFYEKLQTITVELESQRKMGKHRIYRLITDLQYAVHTIIYACRIQNYDNVVRNFTAMTEQLMQVLNEVFEDLAYYNQLGEVVNPDAVSASLEDILNAQDNRDYILMADLLELQLVPFLQSVQGVIRTLDPCDVELAVWENNMAALKECNHDLWKKILEYHEKYERETADGSWQGKHHLEDTNSGAFTMAGEDEKGVYYYHSNVDPLLEAFTFARYYYDAACADYVFWGLGLGYHISQMCRLDDGIRIRVFESDMDVIYHCMMVTDLSLQLQAGSILLEYDPDFTRVIKVLDEDTRAFIIHNPSLRHIRDVQIKKQMEMFFMRDSGKRNCAVLFENNSRENFRHYDGYVDDLQPEFQGRDIVIVAAGPSLDKNVGILKKKPENMLVLATGTVFRKLINLGIAVDYVIVTDANARVYTQISGAEHQKVPMLYLATAYKGFAMRYQGAKYLICQSGYAKAELLAYKNGWTLYDTGGSVSTTALDVCIRMGCRSIAFIGLDLAYTDNLAHAEGTSRRTADNVGDMEQVPAIGGGTVAVSKLFMIYNRWIANRVKRTDVTMPVYDATEGGAVVPGLQVTTLAKYIDME